MRGLILCAILITGCKGLSPAAVSAIGHVAALATIGAAAATAAAIAEESKRAGDGVAIQSDVRYRRRCTGGRSYKLRCPPEILGPRDSSRPDIECFWEDNEGRAYPCTEKGCKDTPEQLLRWCGDL
jgi:hypothetical protein